ncbi:hypothetical protein HDU99_002059 [Rhizoclosmatium hyalinum]|nr:hypothetical protein HDU99_002059 [Rhizoclosmatium hyalinum]
MQNERLTDLKAERAVLILSLKRVQSRAPYSLHFQATTFRSKMSASEYICIPFIAPFTLLFAPAAKKSYGATKGSKMHVRAPPKSLGGALGLDEVEADDGNAVIINGYVRPTVWTVTAELRVPKSSGHGGAVGSGLDGVEGQDLNVVVRERSGTHETFVNVGV